MPRPTSFAKPAATPTAAPSFRISAIIRTTATSYSDLLHYVRSGDFVLALLRDSTTLDEYAFALGALAHYVGDINGHSIGVNHAVPILYPSLRKKYGDFVTYEENPSAHLKTEFGFDVLEVAQGRYVSDAYHDMIGFSVATPLLERAFQETYSISLQSLVPGPRSHHKLLSLRRAQHSPQGHARRLGAQEGRHSEKRSAAQPNERFLYNLPRVRYEKEWGKNYSHPSFGDWLLAFFIRIVPKVGPLRTLSFVTPTPQTETLFMASFNATIAAYKILGDEIRDGKLVLPNTNLDTGRADPPGAYFLADNAYAQLVGMLAENQFQSVSPELRANILAYYSDPNAPIATRKRPGDWARLTKELEQLKAAAPPAPAAPSPAPPATPAPQQ